MASRQNTAKLIKIAKSRKKMPRELRINRKGPRPNLSVLKEYQARVQSLGYDEANIWFHGLDGNITNQGVPNVPPGKHEIAMRQEEVLKMFDDPQFIEIVDNTRQRCRIFFGSGKKSYIIQWLDKVKSEVRLSMTYATFEKAHTHWIENKVHWKYKRSTSGSE